jgi:hypothetical protein
MPKHGSWLNVAKIELSALSVQCLNRCFEGVSALATEKVALEKRRNARQKPIKWQLRTEQAGIKLKSIYPQI